MIGNWWVNDQRSSWSVSRMADKKHNGWHLPIVFLRFSILLLARTVVHDRTVLVTWFMTRPELFTCSVAWNRTHKLPLFVIWDLNCVAYQRPVSKASGVQVYCRFGSISLYESLLIVIVGSKQRFKPLPSWLVSPIIGKNEQIGHRPVPLFLFIVP